MPPKTCGGSRKRKGPKSNNERPIKKAKIDQPAHKIQDETQSEEQEKAPKKDPSVKDIQWIFPRMIAQDGDVDPEDIAKTLAPKLLGREWHNVRNIRQERLESAPIFSPAYRRKGPGLAQVLPQMREAHRLNRSGRRLSRLFQLIQHRAGVAREPSHVENYGAQRLRAALGEHDGTAIIASRSAQSPVIAIHENYRIRVSANPDLEETVDIVGVPPGNNGDLRYYLVRLPSGTTATINGQTFTNSLSGRDLWVGPLEHFTVIEVLSEPIFFWRRRADLSYHTEGRAVSRSDSESKRISLYADLETRDLTAVWEAIEDFSFDESTDGKRYDTKRTASKSQSPRKSPAYETAQPPGGRPPSQNSQRRPLSTTSQVASGVTGPQPGQASGTQPPSQGTTNKPPSASSETGEPEGEKDDGVVPEAGHEKGPVDKPTSGDVPPCQYLSSRLEKLQHILEDAKEDLERPTARGLVDIVLASINALHSVQSGFSTIPGRDTWNLEDGVLGVLVTRPLRPLLIPLRYAGHMVLLVVQIDEQCKVTMHVLDPRVWSFSKDDRGLVHRAALDFLRKSNWWRAVATTDEEIQYAEPEHAIWVECAQHSQEDVGEVYTVLNAWALALGLQPNPIFRPDDEIKFLQDAQDIFYTVASGKAADWELLSAFFRCYGFVTDVVQIPPPDRRFTCTNEYLCQLEHGQVENIERDTRKATLTKDAFARQIRLTIFKGSLHTQKLPYDDWTDEFRHETAPNLVRTDPNLSNEQLQDIYLDELDPCHYLRSNFGELLQRKEMLTWIKEREMKESLAEKLMLQPKDIFNSIVAVSQAINELQPAFRNFGIIDFEVLRDFMHIQDKGTLPSLSRVNDSRLLLFPWYSMTHIILIAVQKTSSPTTPIEIHALDSGPWLLKAMERRAIHDSIIKLLQHVGWNKLENSPLPSYTNWITAQQQDPTRTWQSAYYTILNAWSILLGLPMDFEFQPTEDFFLHASNVIHLSLAGLADWKLIWAFLHCHKYVKGCNLPFKAFRFENTIPALSVSEHLDSLKRRRDNDAESRIDLSNNYDFPEGVPHYDSFPSDDWTKWDFQHRIPVLHGHGSFNPRSTTSELKGIYNILKELPSNSTEAPPVALEPCKYFRKHMKELLGDESVKQDLITLREKDWNGKAEITTKLRLWLTEEEVSLAIASVTLAITSIQDMYGGFTIVPQFEAQMSQAFGAEYQMVSAIRFGRPMIMPLMFIDSETELLETGNHLILVIIQLDDKKRPTISVLDSKPYHHTADERKRIFEAACNIIKGSAWWRRIYAHVRDVPMPRVANWIPCAMQPSDTECGYHVILNAWTVALGLKPNLRFYPRWGSQFFRDLQDIIGLVRMGRADWRLIVAFLRCYEFVTEETVPSDRQFTRTLRVMGTPELVRHLEDFREEETQYWNDEARLNAYELMTKTRIALSSGRPHNGIGSFPSDNWSVGLRLTDVYDLSQWGLLNIDHDERQIKKDYLSALHPEPRTSGLQRADRFIAQIQNRGQLTADDIVKSFQDFLDVWNPAKEQLHMSRIKANAVNFSTDSLHFFARLLSNNLISKHVSRVFRGAWNDSCDNQDVEFAVTSVVEAIDRHQAKSHRRQHDHPFSGGFTLATSEHIEIAISDDNIKPSSDYIASRPRRCWFMPLVISSRYLELLKGNAPKNPTSDQRSHIILLVLQEESMTSTKSNPTGSCFRVYILDSRPQHFEGFHDQIHAMVTKAARNLNWAEHRNMDDHVQFERSLYGISVPEQMQGENYACGLHTILNAWILAMGLHPNPNAQLDQNLYKRLWIIARAACAGMLDWKTLVAFFFAYNLTDETRIEQVPKDRHFGTTVFQNSENDLVERIGRIIDREDIPLALETEQDCPYDRNNNIDYELQNGEPKSEEIKNPVVKEYLELFVSTKLDLKHLGHGILVRGFVNKVDEHQYTSPYPDTDDGLNEASEHPCSFFQNRWRAYRDFKDYFDDYLDPVHADKEGGLPDYKELADGRLLSSEDVILSIASIVEAIDELQREGFGAQNDVRFNGGFALASITIGQERTTLERNHQLTRPRRCWIMPFVVDEELIEEIEGSSDSAQGIGPGHTFLVTIQEEASPIKSNPDHREFKAYFIDSAPKILTNHRDLLYEKVRDTAQNLGWEGLRNPGIAFSDECFFVDVPSQTHNWACGLHTIVNAWIFALGLTPASDFDFNENPDKIYRSIFRMIEFSLTGLMDWKTLAAWLLCKSLVQERSLNDVPQNRRFKCAAVQKSLKRLRNRIEEAFDSNDILLETMEEEEFPYNFENNVDFTRMKMGLHRSRTVEHEAGEEDADELPRSYDSESLSFLDLIMESVDSDEVESFSDGLEFLNDYPSDCDAVMVESCFY